MSTIFPRLTVTDAMINPHLSGLGPVHSVKELRAPRSNPGLLDTFRIHLEPPYNDRIVYLFPYGDKGSAECVREVFEFERKAWHAYWNWVREHSSGSDTVIRMVPLIRPPGDEDFPPDTNGTTPEDEIRTFEIKCEDHQLPALLRPMLPWPPREHSPRGHEATSILQGDRHWDGLNQLAESIWPIAGEPNNTLATEQIVGLHSWRILSNGTHTVPTQWRFLHTAYARLAAWEQ